MARPIFPKEMENKRLKMEALGRLGFGALPLGQWAPVFSNADPELMKRSGLRCKAFAVWFPTMLDYIGDAMPELAQLRSEAAARNLDCSLIFELSERLAAAMHDTLAILTRDEQLFIRDRRLQNVHGMLHVFFSEEVGVKWYDQSICRVVGEKLAADDYHTIMRRYYPTMQENELELLGRVTQSPAWISLGTLYYEALTGDHLKRMATEL